MSAPSTTSSAMSSMSMVSDGKVVSMEEGLDHMMNTGQGLLNQLHTIASRMGSVTNQDGDFGEKVDIEDSCADDIISLVRLLNGIPATATRVRGDTPSECKEWYKDHKEQRKLKLTLEKTERKAATDAAKLELKGLVKSVPESKTPIVDVMSTKGVFDGAVRTCGEGLDHLMMGVQKRLNHLHMTMRHLASLTEQQIDEESDFKESVEFEDISHDDVGALVRMLEEVPTIIAIIRGPPPPDDKESFKAHCEERKAQLAADEAQYQADNVKAQLELKALDKAEAAAEKAAAKAK